MSVRLSIRLLVVGILGLTPYAVAFEYSHGTSYIEPLKYSADFSHFEYVNPNAPKGGIVRFPDYGTYDSFNGILDKGRAEGRSYRLGAAMLLYDRLLEPAIDEPASYY
ncbi:MAG: ABC transporter substrate-binding protein, partial [Gammaproteobacteria bacterium]|nr:ABC transporter substrate-binding protein [Gammaproteobacteria bacterium]